MKVIKIVAALLGVLLIAVSAVAIYGFSTRGLIESYSRDGLAKNELALGIDGDARLAFWPTPTLTIEQVRLRDSRSDDDLITVQRMQAELAFGDLLTGRVHIKDLSLTQPVLQSDAMLARAKRMAAARGGPPGPAVPLALPGSAAGVTIDSVTATNGVLRMRDGRESGELRFDQVRLGIMPGVAGRSSLLLNGRFGDATVRLIAGLEKADRLADEQPISIDATITAPGALKSPASVTAIVTKTGPLLKVDGLNGTIDQGRLRGTISVSFASAKPFVDATLQSERLDLTNLVDTISNTPGALPGAAADTSSPAARAAPSPPERRDTAPGAPGSRASPAASPPAVQATRWSDKPLNFFGLGLFEGNFNLSAREVILQNMRVAPAAIEATLLQNKLTVTLAPSGLYGGQATGEVVIDRTSGDPALAMRLAFSEINAATFLRDNYDFDHLSGRARGAVELQGNGESPLRIVSGLKGQAEIKLENGTVRGLNLPQMVRSLLNTILSGWQPRASEETQFTSFGGTFTIANGVARSNDIKLIGPMISMAAAGSADLRAETLDFRANPRLAAGSAVGGAAGQDAGIGVPVVIRGPWAAPQIYADVPNILSNTQTALRALRNALGTGSTPDIATPGASLPGIGTPGSAAGAAPNQTPAPGAGAASPNNVPLNGIIEGLSKGLNEATGDPAKDGGRIAEELLKALGSSRSTAMPPETTAPRSGITPPQSATPRSVPAPAPAPDRELDRGAREILRDLLGR